MHAVWFKRDLRLQDHAPLAAAAAHGRVLPLYIVEPELWRQPELSGRHFAFLAECLADLDTALRKRGAKLVVRVGEAPSVLARLHREQPITAIHAHEETGTFWTYQRDRAVRRWARASGIPFLEVPQHGVVRRLRSRDGWARHWDRFMAVPRLPAPSALDTVVAASDPMPSPEALGIADDPCPERQTGGRREAVALLRSFLRERGRSYRKAMSSPHDGAQACSRLSAHLVFGCLSMREVTQAALRAQAEHRAGGDATFAASIASLLTRLHWHCHFIQKLEDDPSIEWRNLHPAYDGLRPELDDALVEAWAQGATGYPFVDACMRSLQATGWLNFRMRAMVMAFASYQLWRHWRAPAVRMARLFTDFEPGIHYPQAQMQAATTGVNTARIYNPVKQSLDQDPDGRFIRRWVPELAALPDPFLHEPWRAPPEFLGASGIELGVTYPHRIVEHVEAARLARERIYGVRRKAGYGKAADAIQEKHGSRKSGLPQVERAVRPADSRQSSFGF